MSIQRRLHEAVEASRFGERFNVSEDPGRINLSAEMTGPALHAWSGIEEVCPEWMQLRFQDDTLDEVSPAQVRPGSFVRVTITFACAAGTLSIVTREGWRSVLISDGLMMSVRVVQLAFETEGFDTLGFNMRPWTRAPADLDADVREDSKGIGPRRLVRSGSPEAMPPTRIEPWIASGPVGAGEGAAIWMVQACRWLARSLPNEIYLVDGVTKVRLVGQPPRDLAMGGVVGSACEYDFLREASQWVYVDGADTEIRHTFLSAELARAWSDDNAFAERLPDRVGSALESARLLYRAHLRSGGKDTLKALADLRKSLSDEIQKVVQQSRDLSASVWRDVAVALAAVSLKAVTDGAKLGASSAFVLIYVLVALYLVGSFRMSIATHRSYLRIVEQSLSTWRTKLYGFLDESDWKLLATKPLDDAQAMYGTTETRSALVILVVVMGLATLAAYDVRDAALWSDVLRRLDLRLTQTMHHVADWMTVQKP